VQFEFREAGHLSAFSRTTIGDGTGSPLPRKCKYLQSFT
jgi:hypothetical protein